MRGAASSCSANTNNSGRNNKTRCARVRDGRAIRFCAGPLCPKLNVLLSCKGCGRLSGRVRLLPGHSACDARCRARTGAHELFKRHLARSLGSFMMWLFPYYAPRGQYIYEWVCTNIQSVIVFNKKSIVRWINNWCVSSHCVVFPTALISRAR